MLKISPTTTTTTKPNFADQSSDQRNDQKRLNQTSYAGNTIIRAEASESGPRKNHNRPRSDSKLRRVFNDEDEERERVHRKDARKANSRGRRHVSLFSLFLLSVLFHLNLSNEF